MKTDTQVQKDVLAELGWEPSVNAAGIGVEVKGGIVTLAGHVTSYVEKSNAERAAQRVSGVKALAVEIDVALPLLSERHDEDIARSAQNILEWATYLPKDSIKIMVEGGWITLCGAVDWEYQRESAVETVRHLMGVKGVSDHIAIKPRASASVVKEDIEAALKRRTATESREISVEVSGDQVTLAGKVRSWSERDLARHTAWGAPGVRTVVDNMTIAF